MSEPIHGSTIYPHTATSAKTPMPVKIDRPLVGLRPRPRAQHDRHAWNRLRVGQSSRLSCPPRFPLYSPLPTLHPATLHHPPFPVAALGRIWPLFRDGRCSELRIRLFSREKRRFRWPVLAGFGRPFAKDWPLVSLFGRSQESIPATLHASLFTPRRIFFS